MERQDAAPKELRDDSLVAGVCVVFGTILFGIAASVALVVVAEKNVGARPNSIQSPSAPSALLWLQTEPESQIPTREEMFGPELTEVRKIEDEHLHSYGWVDPKLKVVRVPIERAMEILLKQDQPEPAPNPVQPKDEKKP